MVTRAPQELSINPYVVLADIMLGLCFIFVCLYVGYLGSEEVVFKSDRFKKQGQLEDSLKLYLEDVYQEAITSREIKKSAGGRQDATFSKETLYETAGGRAVARVQRNSNLQRIQLFERSFEPGSSDPLPGSIPVFEAAIKAIGESRHILLYLFFHGITELPERKAVSNLGYKGIIAPPNASPEAAASAQWAWDQHSLLLSQNRATKVKIAMERRGLISSPQASLADSRAQGLVPSMKSPTYGTGTMLYRREQEAGRVDIVLFYPERSADLAKE